VGFVLLHGVFPSEAVREAEGTASRARDRGGHRPRKDAHIALTGTASFSLRLASVPPKELRRYDAWERGPPCSAELRPMFWRISSRADHVMQKTSCCTLARVGSSS
jgi:hypothetical protein